MKKVGIVYNPIYAKHKTSPGHPEKKERVTQTIETLKQHEMYGDNHSESFISIIPRPATVNELRWAHSDSLIARVQNEVKRAGQLNTNTYLDTGDTPVSGASYDAALYAAGGNFAAIDAIFDGKISKAFVLCRPPGHHSNQNYSRGFCLFNNIALSVNYLLRKKDLNRVAIVDFDVHAGNGTEEIFWNGTGLDNKEVLIISTHQNPSDFYPQTCFLSEIGEGNQKGKIVNVTFARSSGDECMKSVLQNIIKPLLDEFKPEFLLISAGFDAHWQDPVGGLGFTTQLYGEIIRFLTPIAEEHALGRISATLEGGYNLNALGNSIVNVMSTMAGDSIIVEDEHSEPENVINFTKDRLIPKIKETLKPYWNCF
ncbi:MAG: histone deacetylase family protein [Promethearchaeota archaeon]